MINVKIAGDTFLFLLNTAVMVQVMEERGMIFAVYSRYVADIKMKAAAGRPVSGVSPIKILHEIDGKVHVLKCNKDIWPYFKELDAMNPAEREIRSALVQHGELGAA